MSKYVGVVVLTVFLLAPVGGISGQTPPGESPNLGFNRVNQDQIENGSLSLLEIRKTGRRIFSTPFNKLDGYGEGDCPDCRPTLQDNGSFLLVNGLDAQSCHDCHHHLSTAVIPAKFGIGGAGVANSNAMAGPTLIDPSDGTFTGRFINPPFVFGSGGVDLLAKEMTAELQTLKQQAIKNPNSDVSLFAKGVYFGVIRYDIKGKGKKGGTLDTSQVEGISGDLVVRPFGRKGEVSTTRQFDIGALQFHLGMQAVELVGDGVDADGDGVTNEITIGELSSMVIFSTTLERPVAETLSSEATSGFTLFENIGCADCHTPYLDTDTRYLTYSFPEVETDPFANVYYEVDLTEAPTGFDPEGTGVRVHLFADLKRHDMGEVLCEDAATGPEACNFTTARLWGIADTAPYLHDGRALSLTDAILAHGGEAEFSRADFVNLTDSEKTDLLAFLRSLRTPDKVGADLE